MHARDPDRRPWAHLQRRFARLWVSACPNSSFQADRISPPRSAPSSRSSPSTVASPRSPAAARPRPWSSFSSVGPSASAHPSASTPPVLAPSAARPRPRLGRSFADVVSSPPAAPMNPVPQRMPAPAGPRGGAPRPPSQPAPLGPQLGQQPMLGAAAPAAVSSALSGAPMMPQVGGFQYRPLQQPSRQYGPPGYMPPQLMP